MNWRYKAKIQNIISWFPPRLGDYIYYSLQKYSGSFKNINPISDFKVGIEMSNKILEQGKEIKHKTIFEIGTGRRINLPLVFWLLGAREVITTDLNPFVKKELIMQDIAFIRNNPEKIIDLFGCLELDKKRFEFLTKFSLEQSNIHSLLSKCNIRYIAPCSAESLALSNNLVDYHISSSVFEHIPEDKILLILKEGERIIKKDGLFVHRIDFSDHFSHDDASISPINFLRYDDEEWQQMAGNRYMYANRLRVDDFEELYKQLNHKVLSIETNIDGAIQEALNKKVFKINDRFGKKLDGILIVRNAWFVSQKPSLTTDLYDG